MRFTDLLLSGLLTASTASAHVIQPRRAPAVKASPQRLAAAAPGECTFWAVPEPGDTCQNFADWWLVPLDRLRLMNPSLNCPSGNSPIFSGTEWCVEMPELPSTTKPATTTSTFKTTSRGPTATSTGPSGPEPTQPNVTKDYCKAWYKVVSGDGCQVIVDRYKTFTLSQFYSWNPDIGNTCAGLPLDTYVCVGVTGTPTTTQAPDPSKPTPTQPNVTKDCKAWYKVVSGDGCQVIVDRYKTFTLAQFYSWNPDVGNTCAGLPLDTYVCVGVSSTPTTTPVPTGTPKPSPTQPNVSKDCKAWYKVVSGDGCQVIVDRYKTFTLAQFYSWNPDVGNTCAGLPLDTYVCVGITGTPTTPPVDPNKPSPTQPNVNKDCKAWYKVVGGDGCQSIVDKYKTFSLTQFYGWNPDVGNTCAGLPLDTYVCVGVTGTPSQPTPPKPTVTGTTPPTPVQSGVSKTCNKWYYVVSGDQCVAIASRFSITPANFFRWNPAVNTACSNLAVSVYVCVGST
ncbi:lysM domain-containing protein-like protein [Rhypophila decipiens]|uniref:LysM domain-containing protein-like protein n=1 Tax=Rhypophila decipiens TaxID=261697 RepID=A0AAN6XYM2_9PEZI|nr:lysM domain-containing protein-like protein [Rhypophila decipiens]